MVHGFYSFGGTGDVASILSGLAGRFTTQSQIDKLVKFQADTPAYTTSVTITRAVATARLNLAWAEAHVPTVLKFIDDYNGAGQIMSAMLLVAFAALFALFH